MKLLRNGMLLRDEMQPFPFFFQELASCNQLHETMKENNELFYISLLADPPESIPRAQDQLNQK